ncbi:hypothetical protein NEISUBOT_03785 [Neisseria subflava NJ9703]|uniref:Uncharacterized protein n=1 Tax=Neisseria subflava NJ9703 TaxID=546268 RepID=A0A9W5ISG7_NEISU|nr:hypothetical protein NEISUBOT_03785 [Neisseria subflava NJ9703]
MRKHTKICIIDSNKGCLNDFQTAFIVLYCFQNIRILIANDSMK